MSKALCDEHSGVCTRQNSTDGAIQDLKSEVKSNGEKIDQLRLTVSKWGGAFALLAVLAPFVWKLIERLISVARAAVPIALLVVVPALVGCAALCDGPAGDVLEELGDVSQTAEAAAGQVSPEAASVFGKVGMVADQLAELVRQFCDEWRAEQPEEE